MTTGASSSAFAEDDFIRLTGDVVRRFSAFHWNDNVVCGKGWTSKNEPLFVKFFGGSHGLRQANAEYQALMRYADYMKDASGCQCPKPVGLLENEGIGGAILCEWTTALRGDSYFKLFMPLGFLRRRGIAGTAEWLSLFHEASGIVERPLGEVLDRAALVADLTTLLGGAGGDTGRSIAAFEAMLVSHQAGPVRCSKLHGDFAPSNLFITHSKVIGFDFTAQSAGPGLLDAGKFLAALIGYGYFDPTMTAGQKFCEDSKVFLATYVRRTGANAPEVNKAFLVHALVELAQKLQYHIKIGWKRRATKERHLARVVKVLRHTLGEAAF
jgi:hypothetical protein